MKRLRVISISLLAVVVLALAGCATTTGDQSGDTGVDTDAIAATVAAELRSDLDAALADAAVPAAEERSRLNATPEFFFCIALFERPDVRQRAPVLLGECGS